LYIKQKFSERLFDRKKGQKIVLQIWGAVVYIHTGYGYNNALENSMTKDMEVTKDNVLLRLGKVEGQVRGIKKMVENGRKCTDVLRQLAATDAAIRAVAKIIVTQHMDCCLEEGMDNEEDRKRVLKEVLEAFGRFG